MGVGDFLLCFLFASDVGLGDGVGELFLCFDEAVGDGDGVGVGRLGERFRCFRVGAGVGEDAKAFLIFVPNDSSATPDVTMAPTQIVASRNIRRIIFVEGNNQ